MVVDTCLTGVEALEKVSHDKYDIIFLDHMMPEMDVASEFGRGDEVVVTGDMPLKDSQRYVRHPKTKELSIYQAPYDIS